MIRDTPRRPIPTREEVQTALEHVLRDEPGAVAAYVFGSVARGTAGPLSDVDIAVLVADGRHPQAICDRTMDAMCRCLHTPHVDVISLADAPIPVRYRVVRDGWLVVCRDARIVERFVADTVLQYLDFQPLRDRAFAEMRSAILESR